MATDEHTGEKAVHIKRGRVDSLSLYEITDNELEILATGSPSSLHLNFSIALLSVAISFLIALLTTKIESDRTYVFFVVVLVLCSIVGVIMFVMWWRAHRSTHEIIQRIRSRLPDESDMGTTKPTLKKKPVVKSKDTKSAIVPRVTPDTKTEEPEPEQPVPPAGARGIKTEEPRTPESHTVQDQQKASDPNKPSQ